MEHTPGPVARRLFDLVEPIGLLPFVVDDPNEELMALGMRNYWDGYFAARAAPLGLVPAEVVHAVFYNFADGEVARHLPWVWGVTTPAAAIAARDRGCVRALRRLLGDAAEGPDVARAAALLVRAATSAPTSGRPMYAGLRTLPVPTDTLHLLWHAAMLLREHRGDGHVAALVTVGIGGAEAYMLHAMSEGTPPKSFGRVHHLPGAHLDAVLDGLRGRGLADDGGRLTAAGAALEQEVEDRTDELAAPPYDALDDAELAELVRCLESFVPAVRAAGLPG
ncbi:MarR family transcriptional regulator [Nocardioides sp. C4-1]|uniref:SCO6745 family protein n=1 Tax=Nocardioides sp. C4-1 TaxID=3151851 RepID=UPI00326310BA